MNTRRRPKGLRTFIMFWMLGLVVCFAAFAGALIWSTTQLQAMEARIYVDSQALELSHQLETAILGERREDLLYRATGNSEHVRLRNKEMAKAVRLLGMLGKNATSEEELSIVRLVKLRFEVYRQSADAQPLEDVEPLRVKTDELLKAVEMFRIQNRNQMTRTIQASAALNEQVDRLSQILIVLLVMAVVAGSAILMYRIIQPTLALTRVSQKFGQGDFAVRARVYRRDEIGHLCDTFNDMADGICALEQDRLHFVASVAHDLKNPLIVIGGAARRIRRQENISQDQAGWLDRIAQQVTSLETQIHELMDAIQVETGSLELNSSEHDLVALVRRIKENHEEVYRSHDFAFEAGCETCPAPCDADRMERVLTNLISNAVKYSPEHSMVTLSVAREGVRAMITVKDQGMGMAPEDVSRLFKPFSRLSRSADQARGTGLGLFSAMRIVEAHGGAISIHSTPGQGTSVRVALPLPRS